MLRANKMDIDDFLSRKRFAMVGVSRNAEDFSRKLFQELCSRGYDVVPVNPQAPQIEGRRCFARVTEIEPPVEGALLMTSPEMTEGVVHDCATAKIQRIWMHRGAGRGAVNWDAVQYCRDHGMSVIPGECPFMFLENAGWVHRVHGFFHRLSHA